MTQHLVSPHTDSVDILVTLLPACLNCDVVKFDGQTGVLSVSHWENTRD